MTNKSSYDGKEMVRSDFFHYEAFPNDTNCPVPAVSSSLMASNAPADKHFMFHPKGESFVKHTKTLMEGGFCPKSIESSANDWREAGEWFEVLLMRSALPLATERTQEGGLGSWGKPSWLGARLCRLFELASLKKVGWSVNISL